MAQGIVPVHKPERKVTQPDTVSTQPQIRVCEFCVRNVLESGASSGQHRLSMDDLSSVLNQCTFCTSLYGSMRDPLPNTGNWPLYHWTLRALPRGRELRGSMMLRFWSSHPTITTKSFRFLPGNDLDVPASEDLPGTTDLDLSGGTQVNKWMETCMRDHQGCSKAWHAQRSQPFFLPTRLLDVDTGDDNVIRLVDTQITKAKGPYCTLSHAWGPREKPFLTTTVWNMAKHLITGISLDELPLNFQHAIRVTRFLKVRYIWIDSLAIVQEPFGDFAREANLMHKVYRYSHCNIVAADSEDAYGGLFRDRTPHEILPVNYHGTNASHHLGTKTWTIVPADLWEKELLNSVIYYRAWVFQERILSPRILHFTKHQIFWDCGTLSACEVFPNGLPFPLDHKASTDRHWRGRLVGSTVSSNALTGVNDNESSYTFWMSAVQNYTECNLTSQGDKTIAIWSIAKLLRDVMREQYAVGMWSEALEEQMAWRVRETQKCENMPELDASIPSWSWASVRGSIVPQHRLALRSYTVTDHDGAMVKFTV
ncbi:HET-domain-containing protein, partial [Alternaria alternata]